MSPLPSLQRPEGLVGLVTGRVGPDTIGEVMVAIRGGIEAFYARPATDDDVLAIGDKALVVIYEPPRTVYVTMWEGGE